MKSQAIFKKTHIFSTKILRAYDIRGIFGLDLNAEDAYYLACSLITFLKSANIKGRIYVGYDGRESSPALVTALCNGFIDSGHDVYNLGLIATPMLYFASHTLPEAAFAIMVTGSHNPRQYNGFKIVFNKAPLYGAKLQELAEIAAEGNFYKTEQLGSHYQADVSQSYLDRLLKIPILRPLKIVWDPGGGAACGILDQLVAKLSGEHIIINGKIDSQFSSHHPDPTQEANMMDLVEVVVKNNCDLGIAFDGDADRLGVVMPGGRILYGEHILSILAKDLLQRRPGATVIADIKTSMVFFEQVREWGGFPIMWKTGHALIKEKMKETGALLAGEMSGHMFFAEDYYGFDDAIFGALKLISIISNDSVDIDLVLQDYEGWVSTPEMKFKIAEEVKFKAIDRIKSKLLEQGIKFNELDGIRVEEEEGWWLLRASNTEDCIIARASASSQNLLNDFKNKIELCMTIAELT